MLLLFYSKLGKDNRNVERKNEVSNQNENENREQRFNRKNRENRENQPLNAADGKNANSGNTNSNVNNNNNRGGNVGGSGGGSGGGAGGAGGRNFNNERGSNRRQYGKREFDRHSASEKTGVKAIDKRDGAGAHNWGTHKQDIDDYQKGYDNNDDVKAKDKDASGGGASSGADKANGDAKPQSDSEQQNGKETNEQVQIEEEAKEITLDEWKAQRAERAKPQYNIRKAGEGEDTSQWKKMIALDNRKKKVSGRKLVSTNNGVGNGECSVGHEINAVEMFLSLLFLRSRTKAKTNMNTIHPCTRNGWDARNSLILTFISMMVHAVVSAAEDEDVHVVNAHGTDRTRTMKPVKAGK